MSEEESELRETFNDLRRKIIVQKLQLEKYKK